MISMEKRISLEEIARQVENLNPERRRLFLQLLEKQGIDISDLIILPQPEDRTTFPLSFAQRRLWFLDQFESNTALYNVPLALRLDGVLDVDVLQRTLTEIVRRHNILRTSFSAQDGEPYQVVNPECMVPLSVIDLRSVAADLREAEALRLATEETQRPFDLSQGPLLRAQLLRLDETSYVALLTMHHIVADGWSAAILVREIAATYPALQSASSQDTASPLPNLPIQYTDFACWQHQHQEKIRRAQLDYWRQDLADCPPMLELPTDHPRPAVMTSRGAEVSFSLPVDLTEKLKALSQRENASLFMTLLAAFQVLLYRYSGQNDICVGTPIANRNRRQIENLIGFFVNTLVLRARLSDQMSYLELLRQVRQTALGAFDHQDLPFEVLVEELQPQRSISRTPLFQVMFALQNAPVQILQLPGVTIKPLQLPVRVAKFDLTLTMQEGPQTLAGSIEYSSDLFEAGTILRMVEHLQVLLEGIVADAERSIGSLPLMGEEERRQVLGVWNDTTRGYPSELCMHELFERQVERTPGAIALVHAGTLWTYGELNERANRLGHYLMKRGVGPEVLVGLCAERSEEMVVGLLGIQKAGGAYVPLDPGYPQERLAYMVRDSGLAIVVTAGDVAWSSIRAVAGNLGRVEVVRVDEDWGEISAQGEASNPRSGVRANNAAYVIYTSGSTGQPKGVVVEHGGVVNHNVATARAFRLGAEDRVLQFSTINFDAAVEEMFPAWSVGARVVLRPGGMLISGEELLELVEREQLTVLDLPTAYWHEWVYELALLGRPLPDSLRLMVVGGDKASAEHLSKWREVAGCGVGWINTYGPTEGTIIASLYEQEAEAEVPATLPIGRPLANVRLYILDRQGEPVPVGVGGELCIAGVGVSRGYLNRAELTGERFCEDPYRPGMGSASRMYRTGDLARYRGDGNIEFLGRNDDQVKIRGFRVELGEIERTLKQHAGVRDAVVVAREEGRGRGKRLVAYVATSGGDGEKGKVVEGAILRGYLQGKLPEYMVPAAYVVLDALPLTATGKVDRRALPEPQVSQAETTFVPTRTPIEGIIAQLWGQVLAFADERQLEQVGVDDNFFELGGHSLLATRVISRVRQVFGVDVSLRDLFEAPTVAGLAQRVEAALRGMQGLQSPPMRTISRDGELVLSFAQQRMWFLDQLEPNTPLYNIPDAVRFTGPLNIRALERSVNAIIQRHEALRTVFVTEDGKPRQVISPRPASAPRPMEFPIVDLQDIPASERERRAHQLIQDEAQQPFDLSRGPLLRIRVLRLAPEEHIVLLTMHHIISDGWSMTVLLNELAGAYATFANDAFANDSEPELPPLHIQYADFARWQRDWLQGEVLERQLAYWKEKLAEMPPLLELPTDHPRPVVQSWHGQHQAFDLSEEVTAGLRRLSREEGATLFMALLAAFKVLLYRYSGQPDISVGTPIANRNHPQIEGLIGFFVNTLVMRTRLDGEGSFRSLLKEVRETALGAYLHQDVPFEMLVDALGTQRDTSHTPLFQVMFALQNVGPLNASQGAGRKGLELPDLTMEPVEVDVPVAMFDLTLVVSEDDHVLHAGLEYNSDLWEGDTIRRMIAHFQTLLADIVADPERAISALSWLSDEEREQVLVRWNDTAREYSRAEYSGPRNTSRDLCMHQLFEATAARDPQATALVLPGLGPAYAPWPCLDLING